MFSPAAHIRKIDGGFLYEEKTEVCVYIDFKRSVTERTELIHTQLFTYKIMH